MVYLDKKLTLVALKKIHSFNKYLLSTCYLPATRLGVRDTMVFKSNMTGLHRAYSLMGKEN